MKRITLVFAALVCFSFSLPAITPEKEEEYKRRFSEGMEVLKNGGKPEEARKIFDGIIKEEPSARGSRYLSGLISLLLWEPDKAAKCLEVFHAPDMNAKIQGAEIRGLIAAIQAEQALKHIEKAQELCNTLISLRKKSFIIGLSEQVAFPRERIRGEKKTILQINEFFDYTTSPGIAWEVIQLEDDGKLFNQFLADPSNLTSQPLRTIAFLYNPDLTEKKRKENPSSKSIECFELCEFVQKDGKIPQTNIYRKEIVKPDYPTIRKWLLDAIQQPPKPLEVIDWDKKK